MKKPKFNIPVSKLDDPDMRAAPAALHRAARRAHKLAHEKGVGVVIMRDGKVVTVPPDPDMYNGLD